MFATIVQRKKLGKLIADWRLFHDHVLQMMGGQELGYADEARFLAIKAKIASQLPVMLAVKTPALQYESNRHAAMMTDLLNRYRTLLVDPPSIPSEREQFERIWHEQFIFLNKLKGAPLGGEKVARSRPAAVPAGTPIHRPYRRRGPFGVIGALVRFGVLALVLYLLARAIGIGVEAGRVVMSPPATAGGVGRNVLGGLHSVWFALSHILDPVILFYGPIAAIALVGFLLLALGYVVFVRS